MAAVSVFRNTTMADVTSCENVLLHYGKCESRRYLFLFRKRSLPFANGSDRLQKGQLCRLFLTNRPLALRSLVTNAFFKQWVGILLMPKIDRAHKNYLTPKIWEETHLREIFYGTLIFEQGSMICIGAHVGGHTLALQHGDQNYSLLISC